MACCADNTSAVPSNAGPRILGFVCLMRKTTTKAVKAPKMAMKIARRESIGKRYHRTAPNYFVKLTHYPLAGAEVSVGGPRYNVAVAESPCDSSRKTSSEPIRRSPRLNK